LFVSIKSFKTEIAWSFVSFVLMVSPGPFPMQSQGR